VASGRVDLDALVTARFGLDEVEAALTSDDDPLSMKSVVVVNEGN
jgi:L-iditol 2-dehydrogenase